MPERSSSTSLSSYVILSVKLCLNIGNNESFTLCNFGGCKVIEMGFPQPLPAAVSKKIQKKKRFNWLNEGSEIKMAASKFEMADCFSF